MVNEHHGAMDTAEPTHQVNAPVNKCQGAMETARKCASRVAKVPVTTNHTPQVRHTGATQPLCSMSGRGGTRGHLIEVRPACTSDHGNHQAVTQELVQSSVGGPLPSSVSPDSSNRGEAILPYTPGAMLPLAGSPAAIAGIHRAKENTPCGER